MNDMERKERRSLRLAVAVLCMGLLGYAGFLCYVGTRTNVNEEDTPEITSRTEVCSMKVTAKGVIPDGYSLKLKEIVDDNSTLKASSLMSEDTTMIGTYDINISNEDNKEYQPKKDKRSVSLFIENEAFKEYSDIEACHISDNGKTEMMDVVRVRDDAVVLNTDSFSTYVFGGKTVETEGEKTAAYLKTGKEVNVAIKQLANPSAEYWTLDGNITDIVWDDTAFTSDTNLSEEGEPVYARYDNGTVYLYTAADKVYFNEDSEYMFLCFREAVKIDAPYDANNPDRVDTSLMVKAGSMFQMDEKLESLGKDLSGNEVGVAYWDMSGVTSVDGMFSECSRLLFDCAYWDTANIMYAGNFAYNCSSLFTMDISGWKTDSLTSVKSMFKDCSNLQTLILSEKGSEETKGEKVTDYREFLKGCDKLKSVDFSNWDISAGTRFDDMLNCNVLAKIISPKKVTSSSVKMGIKAWYIDDDGDYVSDSDETYEYLKPDSASHTYRVVELDYAVFATGKTFNAAIKKLSGQSSASHATLNSSIKNIVWTTNDISEKKGVIRVDSMGAPIYAEYDAGTLRLYTEAKTVYLNPDSTFMFASLRGVETLPVLEDDRLDTSRATSFSCMFGGDVALTKLDLSGWDTSNIVSLTQTFVSCEKLTSLNVSTWDTGNVKYIDYTFSNCPMLAELDLSNWDTSKNTTMDYTFYKCKKLQSLDISKWNTTNATSLKETFYGCENLTELDLSGWDTGKITTLYNAFNNCTKLKKLKVADWDTRNVVDMSQTFANCTVLEEVDPSGWNTSKVTTLMGTFDKCNNIPKLDLSGWDVSNVTSLQNTFRQCSKLSDLKVADWNTLKVTNMNATFEGCAFTTIDVAKWDTASVTNMSYLFYNCPSLKTLEIPDWNTKNVTTLYYAFSKCPNLETLDLSGWDVSNVTTLAYTFASDTKLVNPHVDNWKTPNVTTMYCMFYGCHALNGIDLSKWQTGNVTNLDAVFQECGGLEGLDLSGWDVSKVTTLHNAFRNCNKLKTLHVEGWNTESLTTMETAFFGCSAFESLDLSKWNTANVTNFNDVFYICRGLRTLNISGWEVNDSASIINPVYKCDELIVLKAPKKIGKAHLVSLPCKNGYWHLDANDNMVVDGDEVNKSYTKLLSAENHSYTYLKNGEQGLDDEEYDYAVLLPGEQFKDTIGLTQWGSTTIKWTDKDISKDSGAVRVDSEGAPVYEKTSGGTHYLYTKAKKVYLDCNCANMFYNICNLMNVSFLLDERIDTSRVESMRYMFYNCYQFESLDLSSLDVSNVRDFCGTFSGMKYLSYLNLANWNTSNATTLANMFANSAAVIDINLTGWDVSNVETIESIFSGCKTLQGVDIADWNTGKVTNMSSAFKDCTWLRTLDLSGWNTSKVTTMNQMFMGCTRLTEIDFADWNVENLKYTGNMFNSCKQLTTIDISKWNISTNLQNDAYMFKGCSSLTYLDFSGWDMRNQNNQNTGVFDGCSKLCKVKSPAYTMWNPPALPGGKWGMDDNEDGIYDSKTTYNQWLWNCSESHIFIRGTINTVSFVVIDSGETIPSQTFLTTNSSAKVTYPTPKKVGYVLNGWYTDKNCTNMYDNSNIVTDSFTLYAKWDRPTFTITFDPNGGVLSGSKTKVVTYGNQYGGLPSAEKENAYFNGWMTPSGQVINSRNIVLLSKDTVLTASYTDKEIFYIVAFEPNGGSAVASQNIGSGKYAVKPDSIRDGYILTGWYSDEELKNEWDFAMDAVDCDMTLYAGWKRDTITVTFNTAGGVYTDGSRIKSVDIEAGATIIVPETPTKEKYTFIGWAEDGKDLYDMSVAPVQDITLYAVWERSVFNITLDANGGNFIDGTDLHTAEIIKGNALGEIEAPTKPNYTFKGWYYGGEMWSTNNPVDRNMTLMAVWELVDNSDSDRLVISYKQHEWQDKEQP